MRDLSLLDGQTVEGIARVETMPKIYDEILKLVPEQIREDNRAVEIWIDAVGESLDAEDLDATTDEAIEHAKVQWSAAGLWCDYCDGPIEPGELSVGTGYGKEREHLSCSIGYWDGVDLERSFDDW